MPSVTPCAFIDREMNAMFLSHCFCSLFRNILWWICHLRLTTSSGDVAILTEYAKSIVRDENVSPCALSRQLVPYSQHNVFCIHSLSFYLVYDNKERKVTSNLSLHCSPASNTFFICREIVDLLRWNNSVLSQRFVFFSDMTINKARIMIFFLRFFWKLYFNGYLCIYYMWWRYDKEKTMGRFGRAVYLCGLMGTGCG